MKALIFGGTTEGRELAVFLAEHGWEICYSAVSDYGLEAFGKVEGVHAICGVRPEPEIEEMLTDMKFDVCIDATHPFAEHISASIRTACGNTGVKEFRYVREEEPVPETPFLKRAESMEDACSYLASRPGNILLTTGSKDLSKFSVLGPERLFPRVLPSVQSLKLCEEAGIPRRNIIAMQGPFSTAMNCCMIRDLGIAYMVTKESGNKGGMFQKIEAAEECGIQLLMIGRPKELVAPSSREEILAFAEETNSEQEAKDKRSDEKRGAAGGSVSENEEKEGRRL